MAEKRTWTLIKRSFIGWRNPDCQLTAGALSFFTLFSLLPLLIILMGLVSYIGHPLPDRKLLIRQISSILSGEEARPFRLWLRSSLGPVGKLPVIFSLILTSLGTTSVFVNLQRAIGFLRENEGVKKKDWTHIIRSRIISLIMVVIVITFSLISFLADTLVSTVGHSLGLMNKSLLLQILSYATSIGLFSLLFAVTFKFISGPYLDWKSSWTGGWMTSIFLTASRAILRIYFRWKPIGSVYGSAAWAIAVPLWIYFFWQVFLFGLCLTWEYQNQS